MTEKIMWEGTIPIYKSLGYLLPNFLSTNVQSPTSIKKNRVKTFFAKSFLLTMILVGIKILKV